MKAFELPQQQPHHSKTISFFSFKGGVGRSALVLNMGSLLASQGYVVAMVDMDLQSPGLSYNPLKGSLVFGEEGGDYGLSDILHAFNSQLDPESDQIPFVRPSLLLKEMQLDRTKLMRKQGRLLLLDAGRRLRDMAPFQNQVQQDPPTASERVLPEIATSPASDPYSKSLERFAHYFRKDLNETQIPPLEEGGKPQKIDFVLIDCRTGYPELLHLSLGYLAQHMVLVSGINEQNLQGLREAFATLKERIAVGNLSQFLTLVFSPIPASEDDLLFSRLEACHSTIQDCMRPTVSGEPELAPKDFYIHYTPILAADERPLALLRPKTLYGREVNAITRSVSGVGEAEDLKFYLGESARERVSNISRLTEQITSQKPPTLSAPPTQEQLSQPNPLGNFPAWHWPLSDDADRDQALDRLLKPNPNIKVKREAFLNALYPCMGLSKEEKRKTMAAYAELSETQAEELMDRFNDERRTLLTSWSRDDHEALERYFHALLEWGELVCGDRLQARMAFLQRPLQGRGAFRAWEKHPLFWMLLAKVHLQLYSDQNWFEQILGLAWRHVEDSEQARNKWFSKLLDVFPHDLEMDPALHTCVEGYYQKLNEPEPMTAFALGKRRYLRGFQREEALDLLRKVVDAVLKEGDGDACDDLSREILTFSLPLWDQCEVLILKALALQNTPARFFNLGVVYQSYLQQYANAEIAYRKSLELDPTHVFTWNNLGFLLTNHFGRYEDAEACYRKALEMAPSDAVVWDNLGTLLTDHFGRYNDAEATYRKALEFDPLYINAWVNLAILLTDHFGRYSEAEAAYRKAIELDPSSTLAWNNLGFSYHTNHRRGAAAEACFKRGLTIDPKNTFLHWSLGVLYQTQHHKDALSHLKQARHGLASNLQQTNLNHHELGYLINLNLLVSHDMTVDLLERFEQALEIHPHDIRLGLAQFGLTLTDKAKNPEADWQNFVSRISNLAGWIDCLHSFYDLAGFRPEWRTILQARTGDLLALPDEWFQKFSNHEAILKHPMLPLFRRFAAGESDGLGDPRDYDFFFGDDTIPDWLTALIKTK